MAGRTYETRDACPECGSRAIDRKDDSPNGRPREHPEPYSCNACHAHFETPAQVDVLVESGE